MLLLIPLLWYLAGLWLDKRNSAGKNKRPRIREWVMLLLFMAVCAAAASIPSGIWGYMNYLEFGAVIWIAVGIGITVFSAVRKRESKTG